MDIAQYIADLLKEKDEVGVPDFGTFYTRPASAYFDHDSNFFIPPGRKLYFRSEEGDPSPLISYISRAKSLSRPSSRYFAEKFGETLKTEINLVGRAEVPPLGSFEKLQNGFAFTPAPSFAHIYDFGLEPVEELTTFPSAEVPNATTQISSSPLPAPEAEPDKEIKADTTKWLEQEPVPLLSLSTVDDEQKSFNKPGVSGSMSDSNSDRFSAPAPSADDNYLAPPPQKKNGLLVAAILTAVLISAGAIAYYNYPQAFNFLQDSKPTTSDDTPGIAIANQKASTDSPGISDTGGQINRIDSGIVQQRQDTVGPTDLFSDSASKGEIIPQTEIISYEIIGASLQTEKEAEVYIRAMKTKGIQAKIVENKPGRYIKVSIGSFADAEKRDAELLRIKQAINKNAWPLDVKIKR